MENITSGHLVINNIQSANELIFLLLTIAISLIYLYVYKNKHAAQLVEFSSKPTNDSALIYIVLFYLLNLLLSAEISDRSSRLSLSIVTALVLMYVVDFKVRFDYYFKNKHLKLMVVLVSLALKLYVSNSPTQIFLIVFILFYAVYRFYGIRVTAAASLVLLFRDLNFGLYGIDDPFHQAEHFMSALAGLSENRFKIFPNLGYWEEAFPNILIHVFNIEGFGFSLTDARTLIAVLCIMSLFLMMQQVNLFLALAVSLLIPIDRLGLLFAMVASVGYLTSRKNIQKYGILAATPALFVGLSPSSWSIFLMAVAIDFVKDKFNWKCLLYILPLWAVSYFIFQTLANDYLLMYKSWAQVNLAGHGTPLSSSSVKVNIEKLLFLSVIFIYAYDLLKIEEKNIRYYFGVGLMLGSLYIYLSYAFGRIDPIFFSRLVPIGFCFLILYSISLSLQRSVLLGVALGLMAINSHVFGGFLVGFDQHRRLESRGEIRIDKYVPLLNGIKSKVRPKEEFVFFNDQPALAHFIDGAVLPPVSSPWVAIGGLAQEKIIQFLKANGEKKIYLGGTFHTFDGIDIRARSPMVYKYISNSYFISRQDGLLFAIPKNGVDSTVLLGDEVNLFSGFDIKKSPSYYERKLNKNNSTEVFLKCDKADYVSVKIENEKNWFLANLKCGINKVPNIYFDGKFKNVELI